MKVKFSKFVPEFNTIEGTFLNAKGEWEAFDDIQTWMLSWLNVLPYLFASKTLLFNREYELEVGVHPKMPEDNLSLLQDIGESGHGKKKVVTPVLVLSDLDDNLAVLEEGNELGFFKCPPLPIEKYCLIPTLALYAKTTLIDNPEIN